MLTLTHPDLAGVKPKPNIRWWIGPGNNNYKRELYLANETNIYNFGELKFSLRNVLGLNAALTHVSNKFLEFEHFPKHLEVFSLWLCIPVLSFRILSPAERVGPHTLCMTLFGWKSTPLRLSS